VRAGASRPAARRVRGRLSRRAASGVPEADVRHRPTVSADIRRREAAHMIREAQITDLRAILALLDEDVLRDFVEPASPSAGQHAALEELIADPVHDVLVDERDGRLVATAQVSWLRVLIYDGGLLCQVESVRTSSDRRGEGIGRALMQHIIDRA